MSENKIAIVTGSNKGLGFSIVKGLCQKFNGSVYLTSRDEIRGKEALKELEKIGYKPEYHHLDVTNEKSIRSFCAFLQSENKTVDLLINNAGVLFLKDAKESKIYQVKQTLAVNFFAVVDFTEAILPLMKNCATIINISSSSGHLSRIPSEKLRKEISNPNLSLEDLKKLMNSYVESVKLDKNVVDGWGDSPYVVSKVGLNAYTFMLHRRLKERGISVCCVHPGYVMSDMTRGGGNISPENAAELPLKLALEPKNGLFVWHNGASVPWDGPDPRDSIDKK